MPSDNPILISPYDEPKLHYDTDSEGSFDYNNICKGWRIFKADSAVIPARQTGQKEMFEWNDVIEKFPPAYAHIIGVPFKMFKRCKTEPLVAPVDLLAV